MPSTILALVTDAYGGWGGIAQYNRDFLRAACSCESVERVVCVPRLVSEEVGALPEKLVFDVAAARSPGRYLRAVFGHVVKLRELGLIFCGHINLVPIAVPLGWILRKPVVLQIHGIDAWTPPRRNLAALLARHADAVVSVSRLTLDHFLSWTGFPESRCLVIPCTYDEAAFAAEPRRRHLIDRFGVEGKVVLLTLGRLVSQEREKGFDAVLEALPGLAHKIANIIYIVAGEGPDRRRLERKARALDLQERVIFAGKVAEAEKADFYRLADAYVMPSQGEGFGITLLEAMACGVPVVGSARDGTNEALRQGDLGILVDPLDPADIEEGIRRALKTDRGTPKGLAYFSQECFRERVQALLDKTIGM